MTYRKSFDVYDFYDRAKTGEKITQDDWDLMVLPSKTMELKQKYGLDFKGEFVPTNKDMMEKLFKAGFELLLECGIFCTDTHRVVKYTEDEIWDAIKNSGEEFTLGTGRDAVRVSKRNVGDKKKPIIQGGPTGSPISEDMFMPVHMSYALEKEVDTIVDGVMMSIRGKSPVPGSPYEVLAAKTEARLIKQACAMAGRPGMGIQGPETSLSAQGNIAADCAGGMISSDSHEVSQLNELKIDLDAIAVIAHYQANSNIIMDEQMPIFGGYAGGVEETTIVDIATHINAMVMSNASWHLDGPVHIRWGSTNTRETLMIAGWACATISEFTNILSGNQYYPCAGPCTEMCLLEAAAQSITDTASGREILSGVAAAKGVALDKTTGMEARMMGEAARATAGMEIPEVNKILDNLVKMYENNYATAPAGKTFQECYNVKTIEPTDEYLKVYEGARKKLEGLGLVF